jgi:hypothetical protein
MVFPNRSAVFAAVVVGSLAAFPAGIPCLCAEAEMPVRDRDGLGAADLLAVLAWTGDMPDEHDASPIDIAAGRLAGRLARCPPAEVLEALLDAASSDDFLNPLVLGIRMESVARAIGGETGGKVRFVLLLRGWLPEAVFDALSEETLSLWRRSSRTSLEEIAGAKRAGAIRKCAFEEWRGHSCRFTPEVLAYVMDGALEAGAAKACGELLRKDGLDDEETMRLYNLLAALHTRLGPDRLAEKLGGRTGKKENENRIGALEIAVHPPGEESEAEIPVVPISRDLLKAGDWLVLFAKIAWMCNALPVETKLPSALAGYEDAEIGAAIRSFISGEEWKVDGAFWERIDAFLRIRRTETADRARLALLIAGVVPGHHEPRPGASAVEAERLLEKFPPVPIATLVGEENVEGIQRCCFENWLAQFGERLSPRIVLRAMTPEFRKLLAGKVTEARSEKDPPSLIDLSGVLAVLALEKKEGGAAFLEKEILGDPEHAPSAIEAASKALSPGEAVRIFSKLSDGDRFRDMIRYVLPGMRLADLKGAEMEWCRRTAEGLIEKGIAALKEKPNDEGEIDEQEKGESLETGCEVLAVLGPDGADRILEIAKRLRLDAALVSGGGFESAFKFAEERILDLAAEACGERALPEALRLLRHVHEAPRRGALRALRKIAPGKYGEAVAPLLKDRSPGVRLEAANCLAAGSIDAGTREDVLRVFREAFSKENRIQMWIGGGGWGPYEIERLEPAARGWFRISPAETFEVLERIMADIAREETKGSREPDEEKPEEKKAEEPEPWNSGFTWPIVLPLYVDLSGIDRDRPFPLEYLGTSNPRNAGRVLLELRRRRGGLEPRTR